jgi:hypothetical protein
VEALQGDPHLPQLFESDCRSTQELPHAVRPGAHEAQTPCEHTSVERHALPHAPQLFRSVFKATSQPSPELLLQSA